MRALALVACAVVCVAASGQEQWGRRRLDSEYAGKAFKVVADERAATFTVNACDWSDRSGTAGDALAIYPNLKAMKADMPTGVSLVPSVATLTATAKRFDDALIATLDLMAERGWKGAPLGKAALLAAVETRLAAGIASADDAAATAEALARVCAARRLGGSAGEVPPTLKTRVDALIAAFDQDASRSKPIAFYTWSPALTNIFRQDRFLQDVSKVGTPHGAWLLAAARAVAVDPKLAGGYRTLDALATTITNAAADRSLVDILGAPIGEAAFFPARRSHESDLMKRLYHNKSIPDGHVFMDDLVAAVRKGALKLAPSPASGWYDWQTWALEPLVRTRSAGEAKKVARSPTYAAHCEDAFRAALTQRRETHIKDVKSEPDGAPLAIFIHPAVSIEPQATVFRRTAEGYAFLRAALEKLIGRDVLAEAPLVTFQPGVSGNVLDGLTQMENRFRELAALSAHETGCDAACVGEGMTEEAALKLVEAARRRGSGLSEDDLLSDARVMVPFGYNVTTQETRCWAVVGVAPRDLDVWYGKAPAVSVTDDLGKPVPDARVMCSHTVVRTPYEVWIECSVPAPLTRAELRALCDRCHTLAEIKLAISALK